MAEDTSRVRTQIRLVISHNFESNNMEEYSIKEILLIVNPCAGRKQGLQSVKQVEKTFRNCDYTVETRITSCIGEAKEIAEQMAEKVDIIVCMGGDGTLNEVVSGFLNSKAKCSIGYIPTGTTNDFASSWHLPKNSVKAAEYIMQTVPIGVDIGKFNSNYFTYIASFGAFTKTAYETSQNVKNVLGHFAYVLGGIKELGSLYPYHIHVEADDKIYEGDYIFGAISNTISLGGVLSFDKEYVDVCDGKFEVLLIRYPQSFFEFGNCLQALQKRQYDAIYFDSFKASSIKVISETPMDWTIDGEYGGEQSEVNIHNQQQAVLFRVQLPL